MKGIQNKKDTTKKEEPFALIWKGGGGGWRYGITYQGFQFNIETIVQTTERK